MIFETILSTVDTSGTPNFAPMGVIWGEAVMTVRPFTNTTTYRNLAMTGVAVANVTDCVLDFVHSALSDVQLPHFPARKVPAMVLQNVCSWFELRVMRIEEENGENGENIERASVYCRVVERGRQRDFVGFNRGQAAVIEAAILATRLHLYNWEEVRSALQRYRQVVAKTGGTDESEAMTYLENYVKRWFFANQAATGTKVGTSAG